ncbi:MAG TPA: cell division protein FtsZ [Candidatus Hydrogenedentes bacterium]|nr:cell division protein FtsZ [Candidatus Hydrogenedentota bacterium]
MDRHTTGGSNGQGAPSAITTLSARTMGQRDGATGQPPMAIGIAEEFNSFDQRAIIKVCGIGGGGGNAITRMIAAGLKGVEFIAVNTDALALKHSPASTRLQIGAEITSGLGAGAEPEVGQKAALEDIGRIEDVVRGADMVFVTAGLGGGTGTGACPIVAEAARKNGALTVGIVTLPFDFEGSRRMENAMRGLADLEANVDSLIVVPNERLASLCQGSNISFLNAFVQADEVLHNGVRAISEVIHVLGLVNRDFADVRTTMKNGGRALMGIGVAEGENRAIRAAEEAIICPLLEQSSIDGATGVIVNIKSGCDIGMREVQEAVSIVKKAAHPSANILFGAVVDTEQRPDVQVTVIAAGFKNAAAAPATGAPNAAEAPLVVEGPSSPVVAVESSPSETLPKAPTATPSKPEPVAVVLPKAAKPEPEETRGLEPQMPLPGVESAKAESVPVPSADEEDMAYPTFWRNRFRKK